MKNIFPNVKIFYFKPAHIKSYPLLNKQVRNAPFGTKIARYRNVWDRS